MKSVKRNKVLNQGLPPIPTKRVDKTLKGAIMLASSMKQLIFVMILLPMVGCITSVDDSGGTSMNFEETLSPEFREVFDLTWNVQFLTDLNGNMLAVNPRCRALMGVSEGEKWPKTFLDLLAIPEHEKDEFLSMVQRFFESKRDRPILFDIQWKGGDGQPLPFYTDLEIYNLKNTDPETLFFSIRLNKESKED